MVLLALSSSAIACVAQDWAEYNEKNSENEYDWAEAARFAQTIEPFPGRDGSAYVLLTQLYIDDRKWPRAVATLCQGVGFA